MTGGFKRTYILFLMCVAVTFTLLTGACKQDKEIPVFGTTRVAAFDSLKNSNAPVLIDFSAAWCSPCKMLAPVLAQLAEDKDLKNKLTIIHLDSEVQKEMFAIDGIEAFPTLILYRKGAVMWRHEGYEPKEVLKSQLLVKLNN